MRVVQHEVHAQVRALPGVDVRADAALEAHGVVAQGQPGAGQGAEAALDAQADGLISAGGLHERAGSQAQPDAVGDVIRAAGGGLVHGAAGFGQQAASGEARADGVLRHVVFQVRFARHVGLAACEATVLVAQVGQALPAAGPQRRRHREVAAGVGGDLAEDAGAVHAQGHLVVQAVARPTAHGDAEGPALVGDVRAQRGAEPVVLVAQAGPGVPGVRVLAGQVQRVTAVEAQAELVAQGQGGVCAEAGAVAPAVRAGQVVVHGQVGHAVPGLQAHAAPVALRPVDLVGGVQGDVLGDGHAGRDRGDRVQFTAEGLGVLDAHVQVVLAVRATHDGRQAALVAQASAQARPDGKGREGVGPLQVDVAAVLGGAGPGQVLVLAVPGAGVDPELVGDLVGHVAGRADTGGAGVQARVSGPLVMEAGGGVQAVAVVAAAGIHEGTGTGVRGQHVRAGLAVVVAATHAEAGHAADLRRARGNAPRLPDAVLDLRAPGEATFLHGVVQAVAQAHGHAVAALVHEVHGPREVQHAGHGVQGVVHHARQRLRALYAAQAVHRDQRDRLAVGLDVAPPQGQDAGAVGGPVLGEQVAGQHGRKRGDLRVAAREAAQGRGTHAHVEHVERQGRLAVLHVESRVLVAEGDRVHTLQGNALGAAVAVGGVALQGVGGGGQALGAVGGEGAALAGHRAAGRHVQFPVADRRFQVALAARLGDDRLAAALEQHARADHADAHARLAGQRLEAPADHLVAQRDAHVEAGGGVQRFQLQNAFTVSEFDLVAAHAGFGVRSGGFQAGLHRHGVARGRDPLGVREFHAHAQRRDAVGSELLRREFGMNRCTGQEHLDVLPTVTDDVLARLERHPEELLALRARVGVQGLFAHAFGGNGHAVHGGQRRVARRADHHKGHPVAFAEDRAVQRELHGTVVFPRLRRRDGLQGLHIIQFAVPDQDVQDVPGVAPDQRGAGQRRQVALVGHAVGQDAARGAGRGPVELAAGADLRVRQGLAAQLAAAGHVRGPFRCLVRNQDLVGIFRAGHVERNTHGALARHGDGGGRGGRGRRLDAQNPADLLLAVAVAGQGGVQPRLAALRLHAGAVAEGLDFAGLQFSGKRGGVQGFQALAGRVLQGVGRGGGAGVFQAQGDRHDLPGQRGGQFGAAQLDLGGGGQHAHVQRLRLVPGGQGRRDFPGTGRSGLGFKGQDAGVVRVYFGGHGGLAVRGKALREGHAQARRQGLALEFGGGARREFHDVTHAHFRAVGLEFQVHGGLHLHGDVRGLLLDDRDFRLVDGDFRALDRLDFRLVGLGGQGHGADRTLHVVGLLPDRDGRLGGQHFVRQDQLGLDVQFPGRVGVDDRDGAGREFEADRVGILVRALGLAQEQRVVAGFLRHGNGVPAELPTDLDRVSLAGGVAQFGFQLAGAVAVVHADAHVPARVVDVERRHPVVAADRDVQVIGLHGGRDAVQAEGEGVLAVAFRAHAQGVGSGLQVLVQEGFPVLHAGPEVHFLDDPAALGHQGEGRGDGGLGPLGGVVLVAVEARAAVIGRVELPAVHVELHAAARADDQAQVLITDRPQQLVADAGQGKRGGDFLGGGRPEERHREAGQGAFHSQYLQLAVGSVTAPLGSPVQRKR